MNFLVSDISEILRIFFKYLINLKNVGRAFRRITVIDPNLREKVVQLIAYLRGCENNYSLTTSRELAKLAWRDKKGICVNLYGLVVFSNFFFNYVKTTNQGL